MKKFPDVLEQVWSMNSSDVNVVGEHLGYGWNAVCDAIRDAEFYAMDGDGSFTVERGELPSNEMINHIMTAIFENHPGVDEIRISNNF